MNNYLETERFLLKLFDESKKISIEDWEGVTNYNTSSFWGSWLTDYSLRECFQKKDILDDISVINLTGSTHITDQGIMWMCQFLSKCQNLEKISLRSCCNLTENSLLAILNHLGGKCVLELNHTNVNFIPQLAPFYHTIKSDMATIGYSPTADQKDNSLIFSLVIWPSKSITISGIGLLTEQVSRPIKGNYLEYKSKANLFIDGPLVNIINYRYTEVPIHVLVPKTPGHILILVSDNVDEAVPHVVDTVAYFLSSEMPRSGVPSFELKEERKQYKMAAQKQKMASKKQSKMSKNVDDFNYEIESNDLVDEEDFVYKNLTIDNGTIQNWGSGVWISKLALDERHSIIQINCDSGFTAWNTIKMGFCEHQNNLTRAEPASSHIVMYHVKERMISYMHDKKIVRQQVGQALPNKSIVMEFRVSAGQLMSNSKAAKFFVLEVDGLPCWSRPISVPDGQLVVPFLIFEDKNCSVKLSGDWTLSGTYSNKRSTVTMQPSKAKLYTQFTVVSYGPNSQKVHKEIHDLEWDNHLAGYKKKLNELIENTKKKLGEAVDMSDCLQLSEATRQLERLEEFINLNNKSKNKTIKTFMMNSYNEKDIKDIILSINEIVKEEEEIQPYRFLPSIFSAASEAVLKLGKNYVKKDELRTIDGLGNIDRMPSLLDKMFSEMAGLYIKKFGLLIMNIEWFDGLLNEVAKTPTDKANYKSLGVHRDSKVWTQLALSKVLEKFTIPQCDYNLWINFLMDLGLLVQIPCIRFITTDEPYFYINPMESESGKRLHLEQIRKSIDGLSQKIMATVRYNKINQDLYSLYPQLLSRVIAIGYLQLLSPLATVIHISGGIELMIEAAEDNITISAYMPQPPINEVSDIRNTNFISYIWSVVHLCTDALDALLSEQNIIALKSHNRSEEPPLNYSVCYSHKWSEESSSVNVCSLCGNCASEQGLDCPYNRIPSQRRGYCLCLISSRSCKHCGICKLCAATHWNYHCKSHPGEPLMFESDGILLPNTIINVALSPKITVEVFNRKNFMFFGLIKAGHSDVIDIIEERIVKKDSIERIDWPQSLESDYINFDSVTISITDLPKSAELENIQSVYQYAVCRCVDFNEELKLLTYQCDKNVKTIEEYPVGIFISYHPFTKEKKEFSIEIVNAGVAGFITVGLVNENYPANRQPGWDMYSIGYHGDDGGIYTGVGQYNSQKEKFSTKGCKIEVCVMDVETSEGPSSRFVIFKKDGREMAKEAIKYDGDVYAAIGFHSMNEQVRLLNDLIWRCDNAVDPIAAKSFDGLIVSPRDTLPFKNSSVPTGLIHIMPGNRTMKKITFRLVGTGNSLKSVHNIKERYKDDATDNIVVFTMTDVTENDLISFTVELSKRVSSALCTLQMDIEVVDGKVIHIEWNLSEQKSSRCSGYKNALNIVEVESPQTPPALPSYLLTVEKGSHLQYYHITNTDYSLLIKGERNNLWIKSGHLMRPSYTRLFQKGNIVSYNSKPVMVVRVDKATKEITVTGNSSSIPFNSNDIKPLSKYGKSLLSLTISKDGKFQQITQINKSSFLAFPPSRPSPTMFTGEDITFIVDSDLFFANECDKYHGLNVCLLNLLSMHEEVSQKSSRCYGAIALPFNAENNLDVSQFIWEHSFAELLKCSSILFYPLCAGRALIYDSLPHLLHVSGISPKKDGLDESELFKQIYLNCTLLETHRNLLNSKLILAKIDHIVTQTIFLDKEIKYLIFIMLEKITNAMLLNNLMTNDKLFFSGNLDLMLGGICNKNYRTLCMDGDNLSCRLHSTNFLEEVDLVELADEFSGDVETIATNSLLEYGEYSQSIVFTGRDLKILPEKVFLRFPNLYSLELRNMHKIDHIPETIYEIKGLQKLTISRLQLEKMPQLSKFPCLKQLSISYCPISSYDAQEDLLRLESAKLLSLPMVTLPSCISRSTQLVNLEIQLTGLETLPKELGNLQNLKELKILGGTLFYNLFSEKIDTNQKIDEELLIEYPEISQFKLGDLGKMIKSMLPAVNTFINIPRIGSGYSSTSDVQLFGGFPMAVLQLTNLTSLSLHYQSIRHVPKQIKNLINLENLDLSFNHLLESIPGEISELPVMKKIGLMHCPALTVPPQEIISRGSGAILAYLKYLLAKRVTCNRTKLMFVGLGEAGKTSLLYALTSPINTAKSIDGEESTSVTDGIDIAKYTIDLPNNENIQFSTWDFAGQDVYYNTHQFFLSSKAIYIVVWSVRQGIEHGDLDFWLSSISCHAKDAPVLVVGTRCDQVQAQTSSFITLKQRYPQIASFHLVDSFTGTGIEDLRKGLVDVAMALPYMHQDIPSTILDLETRIIKFRQEKDFITYKEFEDIALGEGILEKDVKNVMQILHDFGSIQYFNTERLKSYVVINPQWIVDIMGNVVSVVNQKITDGIFYYKDMGEVWKDVDNGLHDWMLNLTEEFDLTFPHPAIEPRANMVPCLLSEEEPEIVWPSLPPQANWKYFQIHYLFEFLPAGLFNRIQVRLFDFTETKNIWKYGTYFLKNEHHVLLKRDSKTKLTIRAIGVRPVNVLAMIDEVIRNLIRTSFFGVEFQMEIACPDCIEYGTVESNMAIKYWSKVCMFQSRIIKKAISKKVEYLQCAELHLNSLKSIKENTPDTPSPEEFVADLSLKVQTVKGLYTSSDKVLIVLHSVKDFEKDGLLKDEKLDEILCGSNLTCKRINETCLSKWKPQMSNCSLCLIILSENLAAITEMNDILDYVKLFKKSFILVITGHDPQIKSTWIHGPFFNSVHIKMTEPELLETKYGELGAAIKHHCSDAPQSKKDYYDCFISYCWSNSQDAVNKGSRVISGAISCAEADPRRLCNYLGEQGVSCWIDVDSLTNNIGLTTQLSYALQDSKIMIAFVSKEYDNSDNCKMELRYMLEVLRRPVIFVRVGSNFEISINSEVILMMQRNNATNILDFTSKQTIAEDKLLELVQSTIQKCSQPSRKQEDIQTESISAALNEQVELIFRQFLNQLIQYSEEHCPRLVVIDTEDLKDGDTESVNDGLVLKVICENENGWHVVNDVHRIGNEDKDDLIGNSSVYLYLMYQVLQYKNPGLNCLQANTVNSNKLIEKISQTAKSSEMKLEESYRNLIQYYMKFDTKLNNCSLKRYRLASGRELWICDNDATRHSRRTLIDRDVVLQDSRLNPVDEYDKEIHRQLKANAEVEALKYWESFMSITNVWIDYYSTTKPVNIKVTPSNIRLVRQNTMLLTEREIVTNRAETTVVPIRRMPTISTVKEELLATKTDNDSTYKPALDSRRHSKVPRQNITGSRVCLLQ